MKQIFDHFETSLNLESSHEALYERGKLFAITEDYERALQDLRKAAPMAPWNYKIRQAKSCRFCDKKVHWDANIVLV